MAEVLKQQEQEPSQQLEKDMVLLERGIMVTILRSLSQQMKAIPTIIRWLGMPMKMRSGL